MEVLNAIVFYITTFIIVISVVFVIMSKTTLNSIIFSIIVFLGFAVLFFMQNAPFNAAAQISIYAVGMTLMFLFALTLINEKEEQVANFRFKISKFFASIFVALFGGIIYFLLKDDFQSFLMSIDYSKEIIQKSALNTTSIIGVEMFKKYLLGFEICSILLLIVLIGVGTIFLAKKGDKN